MSLRHGDTQTACNPCHETRRKLVMLGVFIEQALWPRKALYLIGVYLCLKFKSVARYVASGRYRPGNTNPIGPRKSSERPRQFWKDQENPAWFSSVSTDLENGPRFSGNHTENPLTRELENGNRKIWFVSGGGNLPPRGQILNLPPNFFTILYSLFTVRNCLKAVSYRK